MMQLKRFLPWESSSISILPFAHSSRFSPPPNTGIDDNSVRGHGFFRRTFDYPLTHHNGASTSHGETSSSWSSSSSIETDFVPVGPRNKRRYRRGRRTRSSSSSFDHILDYNAILLRLIKEDGSKAQIVKLLTKDHLHELMMDKVGNCFVQSLIEYCDDSFIDHLLLSLIQNEDLFLLVCLHTLGHGALLKLMDRLTYYNQQSTIALVISKHAITLATTFNGGHEVLKRCFLSLPRQANELILLRIAQNCSAVVRDPAGCCILQVCIEYARGAVREALVSPLIQDAENLSRHPYGNYVIQYIIELDGANLGRRVIKKLRNKFSELSLNKYGSNVVEKCMVCCESGADEIISELMESDENLVRVSENEYGNYVIQRAISIAKREAYGLLSRSIKSKRLVLQLHPYGNNVMLAVKRHTKKSKSLRF